MPACVQATKCRKSTAENKYGRPHFLKAIASGFDGAVGGEGERFGIRKDGALENKLLSQDGYFLCLVWARRQPTALVTTSVGLYASKGNARRG